MNRHPDTNKTGDSDRGPTGQEKSPRDDLNASDATRYMPGMCRRCNWCEARSNDRQIVFPLKRLNLSRPYSDKDFLREKVPFEVFVRHSCLSEDVSLLHGIASRKAGQQADAWQRCHCAQILRRLTRRLTPWTCCFHPLASQRAHLRRIVTIPHVRQIVHHERQSEAYVRCLAGLHNTTRCS